MRRTDPLIIGAGPAGCATAITLATAGQASVLVDQYEQAPNTLCGGFLSWRTLEQLNALGLDLAQLPGHAVHSLRVFSTTAKIEADLPAASMGLSRHTLDTSLRRHAQQLGVPLICNRIRSIGHDHVEGTLGNIDFETVFLASGKQDIRGARRPRLAPDPTLGLRLQIAPAPGLSALIEGAIELHLFDGRYAGLVLQEGGVANLCMAVRKSRLERHGGSPDQLIEALGKECPPLGQRLDFADPAMKFDAIGAVPYRWLARTTRHGLFRIGDQAAVIPSLAGEGMGIALASGAEAAHVWLKGGAASAPLFQRQFAKKIKRPMALASLCWLMAEKPMIARAMLSFLGPFPGLTKAALHATRIV